MALKRETREQVGLKPPKNRRYDVTPKGVSIHWPGADSRFRGMEHSKHRGLLRNWQSQHMDRGSNDIEYGSVICPCGIWMECRTEWDKPMVRVGSNGSAKANTEYTSVQIMLGPKEPILTQEAQWLGEAVAWLRSQGWGGRVVGHRDLSSTSCPGNSVYNALAQIKQYASQSDAPAPEPSRPTAPEEDDVVVIFINYKGDRYACYPAAGVKRRIGSPTQERNIKHITERVGGKVYEWSESKDVDDPGAFGVTIQ